VQLLDRKGDMRVTVQDLAHAIGQSDTYRNHLRAEKLKMSPPLKVTKVDVATSPVKNVKFNIFPEDNPTPVTMKTAKSSSYNG